MRKASPQGVWEDFRDQLDEQGHYYESSWNALPAAKERRIATENYALTIGVMFEGFVNDFIFAYANRDCSRVMQHLEDSVRGCLGSTPKALAAFEKFADFKHRKHLKKDELKEILDPNGRNTSFPNFAAIEDRARKWLSDAHRDIFVNLTGQEKKIVDVTIAIRNNLAHRSKGSLDRLNKELCAGPLNGTYLQRNVNLVQQAGHFLKSKSRPNGNENRATILGHHLRTVAEKLTS